MELHETFTILTYDLKEIDGMLTYYSEQVMRFRMSYKDQEYTLEKSILSKPYRWKIREYSNAVDLTKLMKRLPEITEAIDSKVNSKPSRPEYGYKR